MARKKKKKKGRMPPQLYEALKKRKKGKKGVPAGYGEGPC